jgi:hypothetical protein
VVVVLLLLLTRRTFRRNRFRIVSSVPAALVAVVVDDVVDVDVVDVVVDVVAVGFDDPRRRLTFALARAGGVLLSSDSLDDIVRASDSDAMSAVTDVISLSDSQCSSFSFLTLAIVSLSSVPVACSRPGHPLEEKGKKFLFFHQSLLATTVSNPNNLSRLCLCLITFCGHSLHIRRISPRLSFTRADR